MARARAVPTPIEPLTEPATKWTGTGANYLPDKAFRQTKHRVSGIRPMTYASSRSRHDVRVTETGRVALNNRHLFRALALDVDTNERVRPR